MNINSNGSQGPGPTSAVQNEASVHELKSQDAKSGVKFSDFIEESPAAEQTQNDAASKAYHAAVRVVANELQANGQPLDERAVDKVVALAVRTQFDGKLDESAMTERVEEAVFFLGDDPTFADAAISDLRDALEAEG